MGTTSEGIGGGRIRRSRRIRRIRRSWVAAIDWCQCCHNCCCCCGCCYLLLLRAAVALPLISKLPIPLPCPYFCSYCRCRRRTIAATVCTLATRTSVHLRESFPFHTVSPPSLAVRGSLPNQMAPVFPVSSVSPVLAWPPHFPGFLCVPGPASSAFPAAAMSPILPAALAAALKPFRLRPDWHLGEGGCGVIFRTVSSPDTSHQTITPSLAHALVGFP